MRLNELWLITYFPAGTIAGLVCIYMWRLRKEGPFMVLEIASWLTIAIHCLTTSAVLLLVIAEAFGDSVVLLAIIFLLTVVLFALSLMLKGLYILGIGVSAMNRLLGKFFGPFKSDVTPIPSQNGD